MVADQPPLTSSSWPTLLLLSWSDLSLKIIYLIHFGRSILKKKREQTQQDIQLFLILEIKHVQAPEYKTAQQIVKLHTGESTWKVHQTLSTSQVMVDINNTVRAELSINLRELTCSPAATVAQLHLAPFVRRPPCWETVSQQSSAEEGRKAERGLLRLGTSRHRAGNGSNISISTRVIC